MRVRDPSSAETRSVNTAPPHQQNPSQGHSEAEQHRTAQIHTEQHRTTNNTAPKSFLIARNRHLVHGSTHTAETEGHSNVTAYQTLTLTTHTMFTHNQGRTGSTTTLVTHTHQHTH